MNRMLGGRRNCFQRSLRWWMGKPCDFSYTLSVLGTLTTAEAVEEEAAATDAAAVAAPVAEVSVGGGAARWIVS